MDHPYFRDFVALALKCKAWIHFEFIFVDVVRYGSHFMILHVAVWLSQPHLLERLFLPLLHSLFSGAAARSSPAAPQWLGGGVATQGAGSQGLPFLSGGVRLQLQHGTLETELGLEPESRVPWVSKFFHWE